MTSGLTTKLRKLAGILVVPAWRETLQRHRVAASVEHAVVLRTLGPLRTVVDIGANRGQFALAARHVFPQARIVSFDMTVEIVGQAFQQALLFIHGVHLLVRTSAPGRISD